MLSIVTSMFSIAAQADINPMLQQQFIASQSNATLEQNQFNSHITQYPEAAGESGINGFEPLNTQPLHASEIRNIEQSMGQQPTDAPQQTMAEQTTVQETPMQATSPDSPVQSEAEPEQERSEQTEQSPEADNSIDNQNSNPNVNQDNTQDSKVSAETTDETSDQPATQDPESLETSKEENPTTETPIETTETPSEPEQTPEPEPEKQLSEAEKLLAKVAPAYEFEPVDVNNEFANSVNNATWYKGMKVNPYTTIKLQILLDWSHASPGPIDNGWGMNSRKALRAVQEKYGLKVDGRLSQELWDKLNEGERGERPALVSYTITEKDVKTRFRATARGYEGKSKMRRLSYRNIYEMFGERFHMNVNFLQKINKGIPFKAGNTITVVNVGNHNTVEVDKVIADKKKETLYAYSGDKLVATYPTTVGSSKTPSPRGTHRITNKVYMPYYNATSKTDPKKKWVLPPGPNNPVGTVWIALSKRSYGIHGSPRPEGISRQASAGCVRLTNWDAAELYSTIKKGATIEFKD